MEQEELESIVRGAVENAASFIDDNISPLRVAAMKYYNAELYGDEKEGRSKVVTHDVRDTVSAIMPSLLRIFFGAERVVEYSPRTEEDAALAAQATDYVQYLLTEENAGFMLFHTWFKDALISKTGVVKFWADTSRTVHERQFTGLDEAQLVGITTEDGTELTAMDRDAETGNISISVRRESSETRIRVANVPPEEFLISSNARALESAELTAHRMELSVSDLTAMGYDEDDMEGSPDSSLEMNQERLTRFRWVVQPNGSEEGGLRKKSYVEAHIRVDFDGDGIAELRQVCLINGKVVRNVPACCHPYAILCPEPEPHVVIGTSVADMVLDIQRIKSQVWRLMLDSLGSAITPRTGVVEGQVNLNDVLNEETGGIIRMRAPGMVTPFTQPFVGQNALPVLGMLDDVREQRTGITKASQGLNADALQSSTKAAVAATVQAAQERIEMIARIFAETGVKDLFRGLLRLVANNQNPARMIRLRGKFVPVQPSMFDPMMDVSVTVGLGGGTREDKLITLNGIATKQESILQTMGPQNPLVTVQQYSYTLRKIAELAGFPDASAFFSVVPAEYQAPVPQPPEDPQAKTAMILAQVEQEKTRADIAAKAAEQDLKRDQMNLDNQREWYRIESENRVKLAEMQLKYGADLAATQAKLSMEQERRMAEGQAQVDAVSPEGIVQ